MITGAVSELHAEADSTSARQSAMICDGLDERVKRLTEVVAGQEW